MEQQLSKCCKADFEILTRGYEVQCQTCGRRYTWEQYENIPPISAEIEEIVISSELCQSLQGEWANDQPLEMAKDLAQAITRLIQQAELRGFMKASTHLEADGVPARVQREYLRELAQLTKEDNHERE